MKERHFNFLLIHVGITISVILVAIKFCVFFLHPVWVQDGSCSVCTILVHGFVSTFAPTSQSASIPYELGLFASLLHSGAA